MIRYLDQQPTQMTPGFSLEEVGQVKVGSLKVEK